MSKKNNKLSPTGKNKKKRIKVRFFTFRGIKCQGRGELRYLKECLKKNIPVSRPSRIKTPYGWYTPDFEHKDKYIEIKSSYTFLVAVGEKPYLKGGKISDKQFKKMCWVAQNIKPLHIIIFLNKGRKAINIEKYLRLNIKIFQRKK